MSRLTPFGFLFGKSLTDLIRGIRRHPDPEQRNEYLREIVSECRDEVRSPDLDVKTMAVLKLAYLEMLGYDMTWAGFHVTEVMASPHFQQKRIGYLAAMQSFRSDSELLMLVTNLLKMDLVNQNTATVGIALSGLATVVTPLLAADVADDIMRMLSHSNPYIRKKAVLALHNVVLQYPDALGLAIRRIADLLDTAQQDYTDPGNVSVVGATVSVICELATHAPSVQDFLELTPKLYAVFTTSQHNWTLIKLLKIFQLFTRREPRLKSRLLPPIRDMMVSSEAISLIYESMNCILLGGMLESQDYELAREIQLHAASMFERKDPNLTLIASSILDQLASVNPAFVQQGELVSTLLRTPQPDPVTRKSIMSLASKIVDDDTFYDIASELINQFRNTASKDHQIDVAETISKMAATQNYSFVPDFQWLITDIFAELCSQVKPLELSKRLLDIVVRVKDDSVRIAVSELCYNTLDQYAPGAQPVLDLVEEASDETMVSGAASAVTATPTAPTASTAPATVSAGAAGAAGEASDEFFQACWWIIGEFPTPAMLTDPPRFFRRVASFGELSISPGVVTAVAKLISKLDHPKEHELDAAIDLLTPYSFSLEYELQERSCQFLELLKLARSSPQQAPALLQNGLSSFFGAYELTPIAPGSQARVKPPADLDLTTPVHVPEYSTLPSLESELYSDQDSDSETESIATRNSSPQPYTTESYEDQETQAQQSAEDTAAKQLYNLNLLDSMRTSSSNKPLRLVKPAKKKVFIASDETVEGDADPQPTTNHGSSSNSSVFKSGFRGPTNQLIEPDTQPSVEPPPVKVKHKKKVKKVKRKSSTKPKSSGDVSP